MGRDSATKRKPSLKQESRDKKKFPYGHGFSHEKDFPFTQGYRHKKESSNQAGIQPKIAGIHPHKEASTQAANQSSLHSNGIQTLHSRSYSATEGTLYSSRDPDTKRSLHIGRDSDRKKKPPLKQGFRHKGTQFLFTKVVSLWINGSKNHLALYQNPLNPSITVQPIWLTFRMVPFSILRIKWLHFTVFFFFLIKLLNCCSLNIDLILLSLTSD